MTANVGSADAGAAAARLSFEMEQNPELRERVLDLLRTAAADPWSSVVGDAAAGVLRDVGIEA